MTTGRGKRIFIPDEPARPELPRMGPRIAKLPRHRGYPVPWFVAWLDEHQLPLERGQGTPDFRVVHPGAVKNAHDFGLCWVCGEKLGRYKAFVLGPMCAVNRTSAEPPSHTECADWSARACPFLSRPKARRREVDKPEGATEAPGIALLRNPGVALVWVTRRYRLKRVPNGVLFDIGEPEETRWFAKGRPARREEVLASIKSGLPALREVCDGPRDLAQLDRQTAKALELMPA